MEKRSLHADENPILDIPDGFFQDIAVIQHIHCSSCKLGPTLKSGTFQFSPYYMNLDLSSNNISRVEPGAIVI
ncbi:unnamed protein product, partial [Darwinula stevensoni]